MLCQSMAPWSWLQAATLRTDPRPQDVAASWAAGSCDAMCWGPVENGFWWLMSPLLDQWRWYHFSDKYPYKPIWASHALACFFRIQCGGPKESDHNLEAIGNAMSNCGEQGVSKGLKKTVPHETDLPKQGPWSRVNLGPFKHKGVSWISTRKGLLTLKNGTIHDFKAKHLSKKCWTLETKMNMGRMLHKIQNM